MPQDTWCIWKDPSYVAGLFVSVGHEGCAPARRQTRRKILRIRSRWGWPRRYLLENTRAANNTRDKAVAKHSAPKTYASGIKP